MNTRSKSDEYSAPSHWPYSVGAGFLSALVTYPWWHELSPWAGVAFAIVVATVMHMATTSAALPPFPHISILICAIQYGLAPWASNYFPPLNSEYWIPDFHRYFAYAGPALIAIVLGWLLGCLGLHYKPLEVPRPKGRSLADRDLNWMLWGGLALKLAAGSRDFGGLGFVVVLLADLRFVGAMGLMLLRAPGWKWRAILLLGLESSGAVGSGSFHELILWSVSFFALYAFTWRLSTSVCLAWIVGLGLGVFLLNDSKWQIRQSIWFGEGGVKVFGREIAMSNWNRPLVGALCLIQSGTKALTGGFDEDSTGDMVMRFNQGWIIDRVLQHVPDREPFAHGETIVSAFKASLLPRFLAPNKQMAGGKVFMARFADYALSEDTSMNLGFAGEMYANFGYWGGIFGCGIYALLLALTFRWIILRVSTSPLWWAFWIYGAHWALKAETDVGSVLNYMVKAAVVVSLVIACMPALRAELAGRPLLPRKRPGGERRQNPKPGGVERVRPRVSSDLRPPSSSH